VTHSHKVIPISIGRYTTFLVIHVRKYVFTLPTTPKRIFRFAILRDLMSHATPRLTNEFGQRRRLN